MKTAQTTSTSTHQVIDVKIANQLEMKSYKVRRGAIDYGRDYEARIPALMALRLISSDVEDAGIALNVDGCSDFDDMVIYKKMKSNNTGNISLVQLKHQMQPKYIQSEDFLNEKNGNFSLGKYSKGFDDILKDDFNVVKEMFNDNSINCSNVELVLYTNRAADIKGKTPCKFLQLYQQTHYLNTNTENSKIYTFNSDHKALKDYKKEFLEMLFIFDGQVNVKSVNKLILAEIQKIVPNIGSNVVDNFIQFITCWSKGEMGGFYVLTKTRIIQELTILLLDSHISIFFNLTKHVTIQVNDEKFNQIMENFDVILLSHSDNFVIEYLRSCVYQSFEKYFQFDDKGLEIFCQLTQTQFHKLCDRFEVLKLISENKVISGNIPLCDIYKALWQSGYVALSCIVDSEEEYLYVAQILNNLRPNNKCIILSKSQSLSKIPFSDNFKVLCNLANLNNQLSNMILDEKVKFQNRGPFAFRSIIKDIPNVAELITTNDIICVLNGTFCVGDILPALPEVYIPRTLLKVILNFDVFKIKNHIFIVASKDKSLFQNYIQSNSNCKIFDSSDDIVSEDLESEKCLIVLQPYDTNFNLSAKVLNNDTHYLKFLEQQQQIQWLKSCGDVNPLRSNLKDMFGNTFYFSLEYLADTSSNDTTIKFPNTLNIISAVPGMGKSIAMNIVGLRASVDRWVLRIDVNKYLDYFDNLNPSHNTAEFHLKFFGTKLLEEQQRNNKLNEKVFANFLNSKNVLILFDGFDEIAPAYKKCVTKMIQCVQKGEFSIWLTTRPVTKSHVEKKFSSLSYTLNLFTKENQIEFIREYFLKYVILTDQCVINKITTFTTKLLELAEASLGTDILSLMGIPLQTRILAEVYLQDCKNYIEFDQSILEHNLNILHLFERFVDLKQKEFISKFNGDDGRRIVKSSDEYHKLYAFKIIFLDQAVNRLGLSGRSDTNFYIGDKINVKLNRFIDDVKDASNNVGIIVPHDQLNLLFLHRTFAEYYAAVWLTENFEKPNYNHFIDKLMEPNCELVRNFFDRIIVKDWQLHSAVLDRNINLVRNIIDSNKSTVNEKDGLGRTPLHLLATWAQRFPLNTFNPIISSKSNEQNESFRNEAEIAKLLIGENLENVELHVSKYVNTSHCLNILNEFAAICNSIDIEENLLDALLYFCVENEFLNLLRIIFKTHPNAKYSINNLIVTIDGDTYNLIQVAVLFQKISVVELLLEHVPVDIVRVTSIIEPFNPFRYNKSSIIEIMQHNTTSLVEQLLFGGVNINTTNNNGETMLYIAARNNKYQLINLFLDQGANNKLNNSTTLHYAAKFGQNDTIELLLLKGLDLNVRDNLGNSVLHTAALYGQHETVELLLSRGVDLNVRNNFDHTVLHYAAAGGNNSTIELFLFKGLDLDVRDIDGNSVLHFAAFNGQNRTLELLLSRGVNLNVRNNLDRTILHAAVTGGNNDTIELLLLKGLDLDVRDNNGDSVLHIAAFRGHNETVELFLSRGVDINVRNNLGRTILHCAAAGGKNDTIELLLSKGLDLDVRDNDGDSVLHIAAFRGHNETVELFLSRGVDISVRNNLGRTVLHDAADGGNNYTIELLLFKGLDLHVRNNKGSSVLHIAALSGKSKTVELLLSRGVDINVRNNLGRTILHHAAQGGNKDTIELLLLSGLDLDVQDNHGNSVLHIAACHGQNKTVKLLLSRGADINIRNNFGNSILHAAAARGKNDTIELLLLKGVDLNVKDNDDNSVLHIAAWKGHNKTVELLLSRGVDINVRNNFGNSVLHAAAVGGKNDTIKLLLLKGVDLNVKDNDDNSVLHMAAWKGHNKTVELLLSRGVDLNERNNLGRTVLHHAAVGGNNDTIELLLLKGVDLDVRNNDGDSVLHIAALHGQNKTVDLLLSRGVDLNTKNNLGHTALKIAIQNRNIETAALLRSRGAVKN